MAVSDFLSGFLVIFIWPDTRPGPAGPRLFLARPGGSQKVGPSHSLTVHAVFYSAAAEPQRCQVTPYVVKVLVVVVGTDSFFFCFAA